MLILGIVFAALRRRSEGRVPLVQSHAGITTARCRDEHGSNPSKEHGR